MWYRFKWSKASLPYKDGVISLEDAQKVFRDEKSLSLIYNRYFNYQTREEDVKLVYRVENPGILIDAFTGEIHGYGIYGADLASKEMATSEARGDGFTPVEQAEIDATKDCITKEAAVKAVEKYFKIPEGYRLSNARLYEAYRSPDQRIWTMDWNKESSDGQYGSVYAQVDALTSELISYRKYDDTMYSKEFKQKYDVKWAQSKAEEFLKEIQPQRFTSVKLEEPPKMTGAPEQVRQHNFNYVRYVNDIPYLANGFNLGIDAATGEITYYSMQWRNVYFPGPEGIIAQEKAEERFFEDIGLKLAYVGIYDPNTGETPYKLVYKINPAESYVFDAFKFVPLDYSGKPIEQHEKTVFTDIEGHWAQRDIELLVELGIIASEEGEFRPDETIPVGDFVKLLMIARGHRVPIYPPQRPMMDSTLDEETENYYNAAKKLGWIKEGEFSVEDYLSRQGAAVLLVRAQGYQSVAALQGIYQVPASDSASVKADYRGHVAIALGQGLLGKIDDNFYPEAPITNAQAATVLVRLLTFDI